MIPHAVLPEKKLALSTPDTQRIIPLWYILALSGILLLSLFLNFFQLGQNGYGNLYYAAAIKSMLMSWHNFFFVSFDPGGFISIDKPPLGFWLEAFSAKIFGFSPLSLLLPSALAGVISVLVLSHLVRRTFGPTAGLLAGLTLAITPISVVTARNITIDSLLVLVLLLAAWMISLAVETGQLRFLLFCALLVGLGFNIKTLEAYFVLPAFALLYWFTAPHSWQKRLYYLALATLVLLLVSLSWSLCVDLTAPALRPYVGSSSTNSEVQLSLFYNGINRFGGLSTAQTNGPAIQDLLHRLPSFALISYQIGTPGIGRLVGPPLGEQIGLLLLCAFLGLIGVRWDDKPTIRPLNRQQQGVTLWGVWFLTAALFFSDASFFHYHYTTIVAPTICALLGIGLVTTWQRGQRRWRKWLLPLILLATAAIQAYLVLAFPTYALWLLPPLLILSVVAVGGLLLFQPVLQRYRKIMIALGLFALLLVPFTWALIPVLENSNGSFPAAGPDVQETSLQLLIDQYNTGLVSPDRALIQYLLVHQGNARYLVATADSGAAAPIILATSKAVMALGGYDGQDQILTHTQLEQSIHDGSVRFFLLPKSLAKLQLAPELRIYLQNLQTIRLLSGDQDIVTWISTLCSPVPQNTWQTSNTRTQQEHEVLELYDCAVSRQ
jgi:4-amino-4-deoxy-L-arabinose transferase-like glycosyltransferase